MKQISILGSTGSIGTQTLAVIDQFPNDFSVLGLSCGQNVHLLLAQIRRYSPQIVAVPNDTAYKIVTSEFPNCEVVVGEPGLIELATHATTNTLVVAIVGTAALAPTYAAIQAGIPVALACKEVLVSAGDLIMPLVRDTDCPLIPIDSEHAALSHCLHGHSRDDIDHVTLTASGGPFWQRPISELHSIQPEDALKHPNWDMGAKITIDSATLANKGLEVIEAHHLFQFPYSQIKAVIHPQSIIHAMAHFKDGSTLSQMALPDMRIPIQGALFHPRHYAAKWPAIDFHSVPELTFNPIDMDRFPMFKLANDVGQAGGIAPAVYNAANEAAVQLFLARKIAFLDIPKLVTTAVENRPTLSEPSISDIIELDRTTKDQILHAATQSV